MAIIPPSLQPKARAYTVSEERKIKQYGSLEEARRQELVKETQRKIEGISQRLKKVSYENYLSEYNKIEESLKRYFISPEELYQTKEYKQYAEKKAKYQQALAKQVAYENVMKHYKKGMLWAVAAYGEGYEQELAKKLIKEGYSPALGGLIDQERQRIRNEMIIAQKELGAVEPTDFISKGLALAEQAPMGSVFVKEGEFGLEKGQVGIMDIKTMREIETKKAKEIYDPRTKMFISPSPTGLGATGYMRTPTPAEQKKIDEAAYKGSLARAKEFLFGKQPEVFYFGDKQTTIYAEPKITPSPTGVGATGIFEFGMIGEIEPEYKRGIIRRVEELFLLPVVAAPITALEEPVYTPRKEDWDKYVKLATSKRPGAARDLTILLRDLQAQYKKDLGRYNMLSAMGENISDKAKHERDVLYQKLNTMYHGTGWEILRDEAIKAEARGEKLKILGKEVSPGTAVGGLYGLVKAYRMLRDITLFKAGAGAAAVGVSAFAPGIAPSIFRGISAIAKPARYALPVMGVGISGVSAVSTYGKYKYAPYAIGAGIGTGLGFFGGVYSEQIGRAVGKIPKLYSKVEDYLIRQIRKGKILPKSKRGMTQIMAEQEYAEEMVSAIDERGQVIRMSLSEAKARGLQILRGTKAEAVGEFSRMSKIRQIDTMKEVYRLELERTGIRFVNQKARLDWIKQQTDKIIKFMKDAGLTGSERKSILTQVLPPEVYFELFPGERIITPIIEKRGFIGATKFDAIGKEFVGERGLLAGGKLDVYSKELVGSLAGLSFGLDTKAKEKITPISGLFTGFDMREQLKEKEVAISVSGFDMREQLKEEAIQAPRLFTPSPTTFVTPTITERVFQRPSPRPTPRPPREVRRPGEIIPPTIPPIEIGWFGLPSRKKKLIGKQIGYNVYVKDRGKFKKVNAIPNTERAALSQGSRIVDNTTSRTFKIEPIMVTQKKQKVPKRFTSGEIKDGDGYFGLNKFKFREYKIKKGEKIVTPRKFIEKEPHLIDTRGEVEGLSLSRYLAKRTKPQKGKGVRRTPFGF